MNKQKALEWLTEELSVRGRVLTEDDTRNTVAEWDSLGDLLLLSRLEEALGIVVNSDELGALKSVKSILQLMEQNNAFLVG